MSYSRVVVREPAIMYIKYLTVSLYWLTVFHTWTIFLAVVVDAISKGEEGEPVGRREFEGFQKEVKKKFDGVMMGILKDESLRGPAGAKGEKGERGLPGADANVGLVMALLGRMDRMVQRMSPETRCGGYVKVDGSRDLVYRVPATGVAQSCVWIVAGKTTGPLKLHVVEDEELTLQTDFKLAVISNPHNTDPHNFTCNYEEITITTWEVTVNSQFSFVIFHGQTTLSGAGFKLKIEEMGSSASSRKILFLQKHDSFGMRYPPPPLSVYSDSEAFFVLGKASPGKRIDVNVANIDTEACCDFVTLVWVDLAQENHIQCTSRSGNDSDIITAVPENMPFVIYFRTDGSVVAPGFRVNVVYS